jgi:hypothetical protein
MKIVYYSNCQYAGIHYFLKQAIQEPIDLYHLENYTLIKEQKPIPVNRLKEADIFIYQPIDKRHGIYSTESTVDNNILSYLSPKCKMISFPYIYNSALWCIVPPAKIDGYIGGYSDIDKYINREPIEKLKSQGYTLNDVLRMYSNNEIDFDYENRFNKSINVLKNKEENCQVKISDFIVKHVCSVKLFFTQNHPTTCIFAHIANQVLPILGYNVLYDEFAYPDNVCNLPGEWPTSSYDMNYWNFQYKCSIQDRWYIPHITNIYENYRVIQHVYPLSYSIPLKCIKSLDETNKIRMFSPLVPGDRRTYIYEDEDSYNDNYKESWFAVTYKKGGYDCLRHYEILANNAIPFYIDIDKIPEKTMTTFPKKIVKRAMKTLDERKTTTLDNRVFDSIVKELHEYTINNLTCEKMASNFITLINRLNHCSKQSHELKVLMITNRNMNYSMMSLAYGLRMNCKNNFIDFPKMGSLYDRTQYNLHITDDTLIDRSDIDNKLRNKYYDYVIIGSVGPDDKWAYDYYEQFVQSVYKKTEIIYIFGGDRPYNITTNNEFHRYLQDFLQKGVCFVRELDDNTEYYHEATWGEYVSECTDNWNEKIQTATSIIQEYNGIHPTTTSS